MEENLEKEIISISNFCEWCCAIGTSRCGKCHSAFYCCREHQVQHWPTHKKVCKKSSPSEMPLPVIPNLPSSSMTANSDLLGSSLTMNSNLPSFSVPFNSNLSSTSMPVNLPTSSTMIVNSNLPSTSQETFSAYGDWSPDNVAISKSDGINEMVVPNPIAGKIFDINSQKYLDFNLPSDDEIFSSLSSELLSSDNNFWDLINSCDTQNISDFLFLNTDVANQTSDINFPPHPQVNEKKSSTSEDVHMECASLNDICANVVHDMNTFGICVLDKFIGTNYGNLILQEVKNLYLTGVFQKGELVNPNPYESKESIRCDVITWINGTEPNCKHIGNLIKKLDVVVTTCNKMPNNGKFSKYKLHRRTKAMIACYPGDGTYYKKHIDNPDKDGRCITCIYYLNQNWDTKADGGLLRMFPSAHNSQVANIEPIFDRMLFFWSDKRNPHEVLPTLTNRFAITVWYFDADERDQALTMSRERARRKMMNQDSLN